MFVPEIQYGELGEAGYIGMDRVQAVRRLKKLNPKLEIVTMPFGHAYKTRSGGGWFLRILYNFKTGEVRSLTRR